MNQKDVRILNLENNISRLKIELNNLLYESSNNSLNTMKLNQLEKDLDYLTRELTVLKGESLENNTVKVALTKEIAHELGNNINNSDNSKSLDTTSSPTVTSVTQDSIKQDSIKHATKKRDFEQELGKKWMGVFASVLVFISVILFASVLLPFVNDTIKIIGLYLLAFGFIGIGFINKLKYEKFKLSLLGCGTGLLYIVLFIHNIVFKTLPLPLLYIGVGLWLIMILYLARIKDKIFYIIGNLGITFTLIMGCCSALNDDNLLLLSLAISLLSISYYVFNIQHTSDILRMVFYYINSFLYFCVSIGLFIEEETWVIGFVIFYILVHFIIDYVKAPKRLQITLFIDISLLYILGSMLINNYMFTLGYLVFISILAYVLYYMRFKSNLLVTLLCNAGLLFSILPLSNEMNKSWILLGICISLLLLFIDYVIEDKYVQYLSIIYMMTLALYCNNELSFGFTLGLNLVLSGITIFKLCHKYTNVLKWLTYFLINVQIVYTFDMLNPNYNESVIFILVVVLYIILFKYLHLDWVTLENEPKSELVMKVWQIILEIYSLWVISDIKGWGLYLSIFIAVVLYVRNFTFITKKKNYVISIYLSLKYIILMIVILNAFEAFNACISILSFIIAIVLIIIGFYTVFKELRICGLCFSLISVAKLVLIDIDYYNTLGHAVSFLVCGILCFVISFVYYYVDRKMRLKNEEDSNANNVE